MLVEFLRLQKAQGRSLVLATAAHQPLAQAVNSHLSLFDAVLGSNQGRNLKGRIKRDAIQKHELHGFAYIGDSWADLPIWNAAAEIYVVAPSRSLLAYLRATRKPHTLLCPRTYSASDFIRMLRPHQWIKNLLVFLPVICAHQVSNVQKMLEALITFVALSLYASSVYTLNDLLDLADDRQHPTKKARSLASGAVALTVGLLTFPLLLLTGMAVSLSLKSHPAIVLLGFYWCCSGLYSIHFKRRLLLDVFILAGLYTLRILLGGIATSVEISPSLLAFSIFFFVSLAFAKRYAELRKMLDLGRAVIHGRGYYVDDLAIIESVGPSSGYIAVLVLALYLNTEMASKLYVHPHLLLLICPLIMYWLTRIWFYGRRGWLEMDPVIFAMRDSVSWSAVLLAVTIWAAAAFHLPAWIHL